MTSKEIKLEFNGKKITYDEYKIITRRFIEKQVKTPEELQELWIDDSKRRKFMDMLQEIQIDINFIKEIENSENSDTYDVIASMLFESPLITRRERAERYMENIDEISHNDEEIKDIIGSIIEKYKIGGIENINLRILLSEDMLQKNAYNILKDKIGSENVAELFKDLKMGIYRLNF